MKTVIYRQLQKTELAEASRQLTASYCAAYRGLMDEAYLTSLQEDHWVEVLEAKPDPTPESIGALAVNGTAVNAILWNGSAKTVSSAAPSGGADNDVWLQYI